MCSKLDGLEVRHQQSMVAERSSGKGCDCCRRQVPWLFTWWGKSASRLSVVRISKIEQTMRQYCAYRTKCLTSVRLWTFRGTIVLKPYVALRCDP